MARLLILLVLTAFLAPCRDETDWVIAARRSGIVELIDPTTLASVGRIYIDFPAESVGLNGVSASADGSMLYVEGPIPSEPMGCCYLYSVNLASLEMKIAASVPGSRSRKSLSFYHSPQVAMRIVNPQLHGNSGCSEPYVQGTIASGAVLFRYEEFGFTSDRRNQCPGQAPGGAWILETVTHRLLGRVGSDLHFTELIPNRYGSEVYGVASEDPNWQGLVRLVRIDVRERMVRMSRTLDADYWRIFIAPLTTVWTGDVRAVLNQ
jgi:hypothetical protein